MKDYKANKFLFILFPIIIISIVLVYIFYLYDPIYHYMNILNLLFDFFLILWYLSGFCYRITIDNDRINFYTVFKSYKILVAELETVRISSFMSRIKYKNGSFYILTTRKGKKALEEFFKGAVN